ncbi:hypothetical protein PUNSTDRAFT_47238 [Punctularia strigosozonata HHB-11173 SS5]|uniref:Uncharacterized protein n=1 Tax=Punctularia strigosozonata (strain HHB-11173) TaxID=741275 RepID=R7S462_PUNST|nr:uncharacterized protein PUNSTDRAFT_47238 [Punctularia strigosozonata HHB-11173 SS5]EIN05008.1 hypothetical protein PUNSTDRAFT_47238 [Punctularia strigosozonata HHB-11173 SS5]
MGEVTHRGTLGSTENEGDSGGPEPSRVRGTLGRGPLGRFKLKFGGTTREIGNGERRGGGVAALRGCRSDEEFAKNRESSGGGVRSPTGYASSSLSHSREGDGGGAGGNPLGHEIVANASCRRMGVAVIIHIRSQKLQSADNVRNAARESVRDLIGAGLAAPDGAPGGMSTCDTGHEYDDATRKILGGKSERGAMWTAHASFYPQRHAPVNARGELQVASRNPVGGRM